MPKRLNQAVLQDLPGPVRAIIKQRVRIETRSAIRHWCLEFDVSVSKRAQSRDDGGELSFLRRHFCRMLWLLDF